MTLQPLVTVICNCYNHESFVIEAIQSIEKQSYKNIEIIVIENGSNDYSHEIITKYLHNKPHIFYIRWEECKPVTVAFNKAMAYAKGDYLIDLAADDLLLPNCVETQIDTFLKSEHTVGMVYGNAYLVDEKGNILSPYFEIDLHGKVLDKELHEMDYLKLLGTGIKICSVSSMMKRSHFESLGGYDESLFFEDLDYWFRLSRKYKIKFIDDFLVKKRKVAHSMETQMVKRDALTKKIHRSLYKIFNDAIDCNNKDENKNLLKRIHYSMVLSFKNKLWRELLKYSYLELKCRWKIST